MWCVTQVKNHIHGFHAVFNTGTTAVNARLCAQAHIEEAPFSILQKSQVCVLSAVFLFRILYMCMCIFLKV